MFLILCYIHICENSSMKFMQVSHSVGLIVASWLGAVFQLSLRPDEVHNSGWNFVFNSTAILFPEKINLLQFYEVQYK